VNSAALENGANSFTEAQAKSRLEDAGITGVTGLTKDENGIWRGRGSWQGRSVAVGLDFRGNISAQ
jgi:putative membrane protein